MIFSSVLILIWSVFVIADDDGYTPSWMVKAAHKIPHLSHDLLPQSNAWGITYNTLNLNNKYVQSLIIPGAVFFVVGVIFFSLINAFWAAQAHGSISTRPSKNMSVYMYGGYVRIVARRKILLTFLFSAMLLFAFTAINSSWYGYTLISTSVPAIVKLTSTFINIEANGNVMVYNGDAITANLEASDCAPNQNYYDDLLKAAAVISAAGSSIALSVNDISPQLSNLDTLIHSYGLQYTSYLVGICYTVVVIVCGAFAVGVIQRRKQMLHWNIAFALVLYSLLLLACSVMMIPITGLGDFCMAPFKNLEQSLPSGSVGDYISYYSTCSQGDSNPFKTFVSEAYYYHNQMSTGLNSISYNCPNDAHVTAAIEALANVKESIIFVDSSSDCDGFRSSLYYALNDSICWNAFGGLYIIWICYIVTFIALYFVCVFVCLLFEYLEPRYSSIDESYSPHSEKNRTLRHNVYTHGRRASTSPDHEKKYDYYENMKNKESKYLARSMHTID